MIRAHLLVLLFLSSVAPFRLPGLRLIDYCLPGHVSDDCKVNVPVFVNRLDSKLSVITKEYHYFDFCLGNEKDDSPVENLGQILYGERIRPSPYKITFGQNVSCQVLCPPKNYSSSDPLAFLKYKRLVDGIRKKYVHHWTVDGLPVRFCTPGSKEYQCLPSFPIGVYNEISEDDSLYIFNHIDFTIYYRDLSNDTSYFERKNAARILAVRATPYSIDQKPDEVICASERQMLLPQKLSSLRIVYTYSVNFVKSDDHLLSRWDDYFKSNRASSIQWFGIVNSILVVIFLTAMIGVILLRTLRRDISRYNQFENSDDVQEEFGWKLVHGDVFRSPPYGLLLSVFVGSGVQILIMSLVTLALSFVGVVSPARPGSMITSLVVLYILFGFVNGYTSARLYKAIGGVRWKLNVFLSSTLCPGIIFCIFFMCNVILWQQGSSASVPFVTLVLLLFLWLGVSIPLTFVGAYFGYSKSRPSYPVRTNQIPRQIPPQPMFSKPLPTMIMAGSLPFGCIYVQMFFIYNSIWAHQTYFMFGFLFGVFCILVATLAQSSVVLCYFQLCGEDYRWWWRAFLSSGFTACYLLVYSTYFFFTKLQLTGAVSMVLYFSYCFILTFIFFLLCGSVGFLSSFLFVKKIYSVVKVD